MKVNVNTLVFDMDDTLVQTSRYIRDRLFVRWEKEERADLMAAYNAHTRTEGQISIAHPEIRQQIYTLLGDPAFMLNAVPTRLFIHLFKTNALQTFINKKNVVIATHRGFHDVGEEYTWKWLSSQGVDKRIRTVHCLKSREHPDKIAYLKTHYGDDFVLFDDNPLHDLTVTHPENKHIIIYNEYGDYPAYRNQNFLIF